MHHIRPGRAYAGSFFYVVAAFSSLCGGGGVLSVFAPSFFCAFFGGGVLSVFAFFYAFFCAVFPQWMVTETRTPILYPSRPAMVVP
jgi:hypothetical protein